VASAIVVLEKRLSIWKVGETLRADHDSASHIVEYFSSILHMVLTSSQP